MNLLRDLRASTRTLFLYEVTTSRHTRLRTIADRLGMTVQGASEYAHGLQRDGLLAFTNGEYRATKKGVEFLHDRLLELRGFVDRAGKAMAFVETTSAIAGGSTRHGSRVGLFMEDGLLVAYPGRASPSMGVAVHDASKGDLLAVRDLEGIVSLHPGRIVVARVRNGHGRIGPSKRILREAKSSVVAALDAAGVVAAKELGVDPRIEFAAIAGAVEAAERGVNVLLLVPEDRTSEATQAIETANAKIEDKIPYESVSFG
ncbi:MAG TPA: hypothetical protein VEO20_01625 [Thermoplasmata archaeon]|nr:hypothetical protein [Thermoplasmata archaeon]